MKSLLAFLFVLVVQLATMPAGAADYPPVRPGAALAFPRDFGSHPDFRIEWWYVTGWVKDEAGRDYGFQLTFFRHRPGVAEGSPSRFAPVQLLFAHAAVTDPRRGGLIHDQRSGRAAFGLAGAREGNTEVWVGDWRLVREGKLYRARIAGAGLELDLALTPTQGPLPQGREGYSRKGPRPGQASYYYSLPQLAVGGNLRVGNGRRQVTGTAWLDHEWSSQILAPGAVGWDWTGLNLDDGGALMAFRLRDREGKTLWAGGSHRRPGGEVRIFQPGEVVFTPRRRWRSPASGSEYPVAMDVAVPGFSLSLEPLVDSQEVDARASTGNIYWEGAVRARGRDRELGRGYLELTGYWQALRF